MIIDFRKDLADLFALFDFAVAKYAAAHASPQTSARHPPVSRIDLVYGICPSPERSFILLQIDTRPGGEPDGEWSHEEFATLDCPHWTQAADLHDEGT